MGLDRGGLVDREVNSVVGWEESVQLEGSTLKKAKMFDPVVESSREVVDTSPGGAGVVKEEFMSGSMGGVVRLGEAAVESREPGWGVGEGGGRSCRGVLWGVFGIRTKLVWEESVSLFLQFV